MNAKFPVLFYSPSTFNLPLKFPTQNIHIFIKSHIYKKIKFLHVKRKKIGRHQRQFIEFLYDHDCSSIRLRAFARHAKSSDDRVVLYCESEM